MCIKFLRKGKVDFMKMHFLGICGTAMGSVAVALKEQGHEITGSDAHVYPPMSTFLERRGIQLSSGYREENIPEDAEVIVVGNAISRGNPEVEAVLNRKLPYLSLPETLRRFILPGRHNLVVTGTHGKTTTTSLLAWIFESSGRKPAYMIGGIPENLGQGANLRPSPFCILEGDEYDTAFFDKRSKFLHYLPELVIVNNIEFDHADIFRDLDEIMTSFRRLLQLVPTNGVALLNADDCNTLEIGKSSPAPVLTVGFSEDADRRIQNVTWDGTHSHFELLGESFSLSLFGEFNIRNAAMAISAAHFYEIPFAEIRKALLSFKGIKRRQELRGEVRGIKIIDDFGHHPTAIQQTLAGFRQIHPEARLWAVFEPRSNTTRRAVFQDRLPEAFREAYGVAISKVARLELLAEGDRLHPEKVVADLRAQGKEAFYEPDADAIVEKLVPLLRKDDMVIIFSNGGFDQIHEKLIHRIQEEN